MKFILKKYKEIIKSKEILQKYCNNNKINYIKTNNTCPAYVFGYAQRGGLLFLEGLQ